MIDQENNWVHGSIVAAACGLGKTFISLITIFFQVQGRRKYYEDHPDETPHYEPTLILCPSASVEVWIADCEKLMSDVFTIHTFYGTQAAAVDPKRRNMIVKPNTIQELNRRLELLDATDWNVSCSCSRARSYRTVLCFANFP